MNRKQEVKQRFFKVPEVAQLFGVGTLTVRRWIQADELPAVRLGRVWYIPKTVIDGMTNNKTSNADGLDAS